MKNYLVTIFRIVVVFVCIFVTVLALMHGMVSEVELRELKADKAVYYQILADRASYERQVTREWSR